MKKPYVAGFLNVFIPGAGMAYLGRWKDAAGYFFIIPISLLYNNSVSTVIYRLLPAEIQSNALTTSVFNYLSVIFYFFLIIYFIWDAFYTPYAKAKGYKNKKTPKMAVALNFISMGLGYFYIKKWWMAFAYYLWMTFIILIASSITVANTANLLTRHTAPILSLILVVYAYWDVCKNVYKDTAKLSQTLLKQDNSGKYGIQT